MFLLARDLQILSREAWESLTALSDEVGRMFAGFSAYIKASHDAKLGSHKS
jgi:hypothetical protein